MTDDTIALAEKVEGLAGPCREMDMAVFQYLWLDPSLTPADAMRKMENPPARIPCYTASLDAVVALIGGKLPGWAWKVGTCCVSDDGWVVPDFNCPVHGERLRKQFGDFAAGSPEDTGIDVDKRPSGNPAIALLAAFLRGYALHLATLRAQEPSR